MAGVAPPEWKHPQIEAGKKREDFENSLKISRIEVEGIEGESEEGNLFEEYEDFIQHTDFAIS